MPDLVNLDNLGRTYTQGGISVAALTAITCSVAPGDHIAVVGASGSGKSTLLHLIGGLDAPTSGSISWPGLGKKSELRPEKVGFIFQSQSLLAPLTVVENVELPLLLQGITPAAARMAAEKTLRDLEMAALIDKLPEELSGGQAQRVAVARTLAARPQLILADEPTGQLDHPTAQHLFTTLLAAIAETDTSLIVATHDPAIAEHMRIQWHIQHGMMEVKP
ncbi:ABC transporter ATP-binding protein [Geopsychrobacter electrodiphilus]|uniref:ABC transporter ATP-binding protein n=1 Tax=Geopsychrobacter electrodiphilus TaxID=225196 RepID=UPI00035F0253|nr:ABC transporter ATP-binding protein [Geopsychrobacter electrodiphilus]